MDLNTDDAQKLWDEAAAARDDGNPLTADTPPAQEAIEAAPQDESTAAQAAQATEQDQDANKDKGADATAQAAAKDPVSELAERFAKLEGQLRNVHGHIGGLTQGQNALREQVLAASQKASAQAGDAPTQAQVKDAMASPQEWEALKGDFPEWAAATEKFLDARLSSIQPQAIDPAAIDKIVAERVAKEAANVRSEAINAHLDAIVDGDWQTAVKSDEFGKWMAGQPDDVKSLGQSAALTDASKMLRLFVKSKQANPAQQIISERSAKLDAAASVPGNRKAPRSKSVDDMTDAEFWEHAARQREKQRG